MALGYCNQCGCKIGRRSANGVYMPDTAISRQAVLIFSYEGTAKKTQVHVPLCKTCVENPDYDKIELGLNEDASFKNFMKMKPEGTVLNAIKEEKI